MKKTLRIILIRHYEVEHKPPKTCNSSEFERNMDIYNKQNIIIPDVISEQVFDEFTVCYCSNLKRARQTAHQIFKKEIITHEDLQEISIKAIFKTNYRINLRIWLLLNRIQWFFNLSKTHETRTQSIRRAKKFLLEALNSRHYNIVVVSHALFMRVLYKELIKLGFKGKRFKKPKFGKIYEYVKVE